MELRKKVLGLTALAFATTLGFGVAGINASAAESTQTAKFEMVVGAQVRTADPAGIRFSTDVNEAYKTELAKRYSTETYTWVWGTELTFTDVEKNSWTVDAVTEKWLDNDTRWYTTLVGIPDTDYLTEITAESYVKIYDAENMLVDTKTVSNAQTRSIAYSASWALNDGYDQEILYTYTKAIPNTSVELDKESESVVAGTEIQLTANAQPAGYGVAWRSSDTSVATVDKNGKVTAINAGEAIITATLGNATDSYQLEVTPSSESQFVKDFYRREEKGTDGEIKYNKYSYQLDHVNNVVEEGNFAYGAMLKDGGSYNAATMYATLSKDYIAELFDGDVIEIKFDVILSVGDKKIQINAQDLPESVSYVTSTAEVDNVIYHIYSVKMKREYYTSFTATNMTLRYTGGSSGNSKFFFIDNLQVVEGEVIKPLNENLLIKGFDKTKPSTTPSTTAQTLAIVSDFMSKDNTAYGIKEIKSNNSGTMHITLDSGYMGELFAGKSVTAITFDIILSVDKKNISIFANNGDRVTLVNNTDATQYPESKTVDGITYYVYTITITKENYNSYGINTNMVLRYKHTGSSAEGNVVGGGNSTFFYVDNLALVKA